ncbi:MAG TPA: sulfotransferase [Stellaceae bacterium]|nr:sulfotransferase [Stellaceae bacterium]
MAATLLKEEYNPALHASSEPTRGQSAPTLIIGATRSGTSWLGKIFDSHPNVLYRHEPDDVIRLKALPLVCPVEDIPRYVDAAQRYVARLTAVRQIKASGTWPVFAKQFQPFPAPFVRRALVLGVRAAQEVSPAADWLKRIAIPDLISGGRSQISYVVKSVSMLGNAALLAAALPESRIIAVFRHPCGYIASIKRGLSDRIMGRDPSRPMVLATTRARELGFTKERYNQMPVLDCHVWAWAFLHAKLFEETAKLPNVHLLRYEDLCRDPMAQAQELLAFAHLAWAEETGNFIERSTRSSGRERYFSLFRNPMEAATKWKRELSADEIAHFTGIVEQVLPAGLVW